VDVDHRIAVVVATTSYDGLRRRDVDIGDPPSEAAMQDAGYDDESVPEIRRWPVVVVAKGLPEDVRNVLGGVEVDALEVDQRLVQVSARAAPHPNLRLWVTRTTGVGTSAG
jgi:hypothetical protein